MSLVYIHIRDFGGTTAIIKYGHEYGLRSYAKKNHQIRELRSSEGGKREID